MRSTSGMGCYTVQVMAASPVPPDMPLAVEFHPRLVPRHDAHRRTLDGGAIARASALCIPEGVGIEINVEGQTVTLTDALWSAGLARMTDEEAAVRTSRLREIRWMAHFRPRWRSPLEPRPRKAQSGPPAYTIHSMARSGCGHHIATRLPGTGARSARQRQFRFI